MTDDSTDFGQEGEIPRDEDAQQWHERLFENKQGFFRVASFRYPFGPAREEERPLSARIRKRFARDQPLDLGDEDFLLSFRVENAPRFLRSELFGPLRVFARNRCWSVGGVDGNGKEAVEEISDIGERVDEDGPLSEDEPCVSRIADHEESSQESDFLIRQILWSRDRGGG